MFYSSTKDREIGDDGKKQTVTFDVGKILG